MFHILLVLTINVFFIYLNDHYCSHLHIDVVTKEIYTKSEMSPLGLSLCSLQNRLIPSHAKRIFEDMIHEIPCLTTNNLLTIGPRVINGAQLTHMFHFSYLVIHK